MRRDGGVKYYMKLMRVHHYIKNLLVFAALACSGQLFNFKKLFAGIMGFIAFCMVSSVVYIMNDIRDREMDRLHPTKCKRPIAAGAVSVKRAWSLTGVLLLIAVVCNCMVYQRTATILLALYLLLNLAYSFGLKDLPIVDITILVSGFLIRMMYGAFITGLTISNWLYLTVISLAFYFALGKRRNELKQNEGGDTRKVLKSYSTSFLDKNMYMCLSIALVFYALWCMDDDTVSRYGGINLIFTVPVVLLITMRYSMDVEGEPDGDPVEVLLHDRMLLILCLIYFALMFAILYF